MVNRQNVNWVDYIYYCIYRFVLRTPAKSYADAWPIVFLALTLCVHVLTVYFLVTLLTGTEVAHSAQAKGVSLAAFFLLTVMFFWHYAVKGHGSQVISSFEEHGIDAKYWRAGAIMFLETLLLPLTLSCFLIFAPKVLG